MLSNKDNNFKFRLNINLSLFDMFLIVIWMMIKSFDLNSMHIILSYNTAKWWRGV